MKIFLHGNGLLALRLLILVALPLLPCGLIVRQAQSTGARERLRDYSDLATTDYSDLGITRELVVNATLATVDYADAFGTLSREQESAEGCSLMGGLVHPKVSARCCFSIQVATQRGLSEYGMAEPCKGAWRCDANGVTPEPGFEEQARKEVCAQPTCLAGVTAAMEANWKTAKAAKFMNGLCDDGVVTVANSTETGLIRASLEGMERPVSRRQKSRHKSNRTKEKPAQCFPGEAMVEVLGRGATPMANLRLGDQVLTSKKVQEGAQLEYEPVLAWIHIAKGTEAIFTTIRHERGILRASPGHLVFLATASGFHVDVPAGNVRKGDVLLASTESGLVASKILSVDHDSVSLGMYAPLTHSGTIVVDGVLASIYATPSLDVRLPHWLAHTGLFPVRAFHSLGFAKVSALVRTALFGETDQLEATKPEVVDAMHPYFSALYHGLHVERLLQSV